MRSIRLYLASVLFQLAFGAIYKMSNLPFEWEEAERDVMGLLTFEATGLQAREQ